MIIQIIHLLLSIATTIVAGACLLRAYVFWLRIGFHPQSSNALMSYLYPVSDWIIKPLRNLLGTKGKIDVASISAAFLIILGKVLIIWILSGSRQLFSAVIILAIFELIDLILSGVMMIVIIHIIFSWVNNFSPTQQFLGLLVEPILGPIRDKIPKLGMLDLSPLALVVIIQILQIIVANIKQSI